MKRPGSCLILLLLWVTATQAALAPDEIAILAAASPQSRKLAAYYAQARGIPASRICVLDVKPGADLDRMTWEERTRPAIHAWLRAQGLDKKARCLVVSWDLPLRIGKRSPSLPAVVARGENLVRARALRVKQFAELLKRLDTVAARDKQPARPDLDPKVSAVELAKQIDGAMKEAQQRVQRLEGAAKKQGEASLESTFVAGAGAAGLLELVRRQHDTLKIPEGMARQMDKLRASVDRLQRELRGLGSRTDSVVRDEQILERLDQTSGLMGSIRWIDEQQRVLEKNETRASFDSELALLWWPDYSPCLWAQNPLHYAVGSTPGQPPVLMVSRLAAPAPELVRKMIDASIATEKMGLKGKVYLDARGMPFDAKRDSMGAYAFHDQSLRDLAERLKRDTKLEVVLDNQGGLFQPGQCPEAALYCGWYSLGKYVDAFTWVPGAVGYHIASSEAVDLFTPGSSLWCPAMLERGVAATVGPAFEPYLVAFPLPDDFFPLLLTGRYSLVETYYRTAPFLSWAMILVGDPLYNPFKNHPALDESALPERMRTIHPAPVSSSSAAANAP